MSFVELCYLSCDQLLLVIALVNLKAINGVEWRSVYGNLEFVDGATCCQNVNASLVMQSWDRHSRNHFN